LAQEADPVSTSRRELPQVHPPYEICKQERRKALPSSGSAWGGPPGMYRCGSLFEHLCLLWSVQLAEQLGVVVQDVSDRGMVRREGMLVDRQRALIEGFGLLIAPLLLAEKHQA